MKKTVKKAILYSLLGLSAYSFFLLRAMPASLAWQFAPTIPAVEVSGISGTIWSGKAEEITIQGTRFNAFSWEFQPARLLSASLGLDFSLGHARAPLYVRGQLSFDGKELSVTDLFARSSLEHIQTLLPVSVPAELSGNVNLTASELVMDQSGCQFLSGRIHLQEGEVQSPLANLDIGQIDSSLTCGGQSLSLNATQQSEMFESTGHFNVSLNGRYTMESSVAPTSSTPEQIVQGLTFMGQENSDGTYQFNFNGRI